MQVRRKMQRLQIELEALKRERTEPIALIGMSCRFPGGANNPEAFWQLLIEGRDAVTEVPPDRYDINQFYDPDLDAPGKTVSRWGGFLDSIDQFDPMFFGISPREATYLDPQQRLLLEVSWEAMERVGLLPEKLFGSQTGVFIGLFNRDYFDIQLEHMVYENAASANPYTGIGNGPSFAAGRISYILGLQGPSMVIDTVCSSSLVAIHLACQSLHNNECTTAFAGAANLIFYPLSTIVTSKMRALSPQGRSKTFDASADGFVRGEGCAVVILKRLSQALAEPNRASIALVSTVTGQKSSGEEYDAAYWGRNMCQEVRFGPAIEELITMGYQTFLEISPQPALARPTRQCLEHHGKNGLVLPSLRQGVAERPVILASLGALYSQGYAVNWGQFYPATAGPYTVVALPTYQWQRKRYWFTEQNPGLRRHRGSSGKPVRHPLLGQRLRSATK